jgi:large subunit ribosomal protein L7/L12
MVPRTLRTAVVLALAISVLACGEPAPKPPPRVPSGAGKPEVWLVSFPDDRKISAIKVVREITKLGLADAKALVERAPVLVTTAEDDAEALALEKRLDDAGAVAEVRRAAATR